MGLLYEQLQRFILPGMVIPEPLALLYEWIEDNQTYTDREDGIRFFSLFPEEKCRQTQIDTERYGGAKIEFVAYKN